MPRDYKDLIDRVGAVLIDESLCLFEPGGREGYTDLGVLIEERESSWSRFAEVGVELPDQYFREGRRLVAFAAVEANYFFWKVLPGVPADQWGVVIVDAELEDWLEYDMTATECIYKLLGGQIELEQFEGLFDGPEHAYRPL
ncbi:hypothetical protein [Micromonospora sp. NPDC050200]|uniref:hypothetical protein n=1 Tax=Micromonospora sp. NPDC050200 TaxID=3155664 RepID=UPI0033DC7E22